MQLTGRDSNGVDVMNYFKMLFRELNKRGVSAVVISIILLVIGLALLLIFIIGVGKTGSANVQGIATSIDQIKRGG